MIDPQSSDFPRYLAFSHAIYYAAGGWNDLAGGADSLVEARTILATGLSSEDSASKGHIVDTSTWEIVIEAERDWDGEEEWSGEDD